MAEEGEVALESAAPIEVQKRAEELGWIPPERYKGPPEKFVDAEEFVRKGEEILPIIKSRNARLEASVRDLAAKVKEQEDLLRKNAETMQALEEFHTAETKRKVTEVRNELKRQIAEASKEGDHKALAEFTDQLTELNVKVKDAEAREKSKEEERKVEKEEETPPLSPVFQEWASKNSWYGSDPRKTAYANSIAVELRRAGDRSPEGEFLLKVSQEVEEMFPAEGRRAEKAASGRRSGGGGGGGKTYAALPADAKAACEEFTPRLVGKGRKYATVDEWRSAYAKQYFSEEA